MQKGVSNIYSTVSESDIGAHKLDPFLPIPRVVVIVFALYCS